MQSNLVMKRFGSASKATLIANKYLLSKNCFGTSIQVILEKDLPLCGKEGELVKVKRGYARNFLIPRGLAVYGTDENIEKYNAKVPSKKASEVNANSSDNINTTNDQNLSNTNSIIASPVIDSIKIVRPALATGLLIEPLTHYNIKVLLRYKYRIPAFHVDIAQPIRYLGQYKVNYSKNKFITIDVVPE